MTYPNHWPKENRDCECGNCDWTGHEDDIELDVFDCRELSERLDVGHPLPAGECPECGAWAYVVTPYSRCLEAAPEMLKACIALYNRYLFGTGATRGKALEQAQAAIAKAGVAPGRGRRRSSCISGD